MVVFIAGVVEMAIGNVVDVPGTTVTDSLVLDVGGIGDVIFSGKEAVSFPGVGSVVVGIGTAVLVAGSAVAFDSNIADDTVAVG